MADRVGSERCQAAMVARIQIQIECWFSSIEGQLFQSKRPIQARNSALQRSQELDNDSELLVNDRMSLSYCRMNKASLNDQNKSLNVKK